MWLKRGEDGMPDGGFSKPFCYHIDQFESLRPVFMQVIEYSRFMGLDMIQGDHEDAPGQLELNWQFDDALRTCDRLSTYRQICAQVARENNLIACFMSKPFMGVSANGCHTNISLWTGGKESVNALGNNPLNGHNGCLHVLERRREPLHARRRRPADTGAHRPAVRGRGHGAPRRPDRARLLHRQLLSTAVGYRLLGAGVQGLGLPESHHRAAHIRPGSIRVPSGRFRRQSLPALRRSAQGLRRRHLQRTGSGATREPQHLRGDGGGQGR